MSNTELSAENRSVMLSCDLVILVKSEEGLLNPIMNTLSREDDIFKTRGGHRNSNIEQGHWLGTPRYRP